jgi:hypothetical protein
MRKCPNCSRELSAETDAAYCVYCGAPATSLGEGQPPPNPSRSPPVQTASPNTGMSTKTAIGLLMIVFGIGMALYGFNYMNSLAYQVGRQIGLQDSTGLIFLGIGGAIAAIGLMIALE